MMGHKMNQTINPNATGQGETPAEPEDRRGFGSAGASPSQNFRSEMYTMAIEGCSTNKN
jgi:hypothetical protein